MADKLFLNHSDRYAFHMRLAMLWLMGKSGPSLMDLDHTKRELGKALGIASTHKDSRAVASVLRILSWTRSYERSLLAT